MNEFIIMLFVIVWGIILTILYLMNVAFQNKKISRLESRIDKLATSKCNTNVKRKETEETAKADGETEAG